MQELVAMVPRNWGALIMKTTLTLLAAAALVAGCQSVSNRTLGTTAGGAIIGAGVGMMAGGDDKRNAAIGAVVGARACATPRRPGPPPAITCGSSAS